MVSQLGWPTPIAAIGPVAVGTVLWRTHGTLQLTVVVKARLEMRHNEVMALTEPPSLVRRDRHVDDDPTRSLLSSSDVVPYRREADVWLTGTAYAPPARTVSVSVVRLGVYHRGMPMLDKTLHVLGMRTHADDTPKPFERMPIVYERAFGGIGFDDNPVGVGADERPMFPNVIDPRQPDRPGGFGPISRYWKLRRRKVTPEVRQRLEQTVADVPDDFDWGYFQAAPEDQRVPFLHGDEWVVLDGLSRSGVRLQSRLPKIEGVARMLSLHGQSDEGDAIALVADTLAIDADRQECTVTWRGAVPVVSQEALSETLIAAAAVVQGQSVDWTSAYRHAVGGGASAAMPGSGPLRLDRSGITVVQQELPDGVMGELQDPLAQTTVDPVRAPEGEQDTSITYRRVREASPTIPERPRYPRSSDPDEITDTNVEPLPAHDMTLGEPSQPQGMPLPIDTEQGGGPLVDEAWMLEVPVEPVPDKVSEVRAKHEASPSSETLPSGAEQARPAARGELPSMAPAPLDAEALAASMRKAGAGESDIAAVLASLLGSKAVDDDGDE